MELQPASLSQVKRARNGRMVMVDDDVNSVVRDLAAIDRGFRVRYSEAAGHFVVYHEGEDGRESLVLTSQTLDQRIVKRVRQIADVTFDYAAELDAQDASAEAERERAHNERVAPLAEQLFHAARKDKGIQDTISVPRAVA